MLRARNIHPLLAAGLIAALVGGGAGVASAGTDGPVITVSATAGGLPYAAGDWTNKAVTVAFSCTPPSATDQIASLTPPVQVSGPAHDQTVSGTCTDADGNTSVTTFGTGSAGIDIDLTIPQASASATTTDGNGSTVGYTAATWTNHDVTVSIACNDPGPVSSGVAATDRPSTIGAEGTSSGVTGGCTDTAGNAADPAFFGPILIDKTAPTCTAAVNPSPIRPASRRLTPVTATVKVSDALSGPKRFVLVSVTSNNPATARTDIVGFTPGSVGTAGTSGRLMAVLGRVYSFTYRGFDVAGNSSLCGSQVRVTNS